MAKRKRGKKSLFDKISKIANAKIIKTEALSQLVKILLIFFSAGAAVFIVAGELRSLNVPVPAIQNSKIPFLHNAKEFVAFKSTADFKNYLAKTSGFASAQKTSLLSRVEALAADEINRISETNIQVSGIDEPDIVKAYRGNLYVSEENRYRFLLEKLSFNSILPQEPEKTETKIIKAFPVEDLGEQGVINRNGKLLLGGNTLAVISNTGIYGYNIASSSNPEEKWSLEFSDNDFVAARKYGEKIYLILRQDVNKLCPVSPLKADKDLISIQCNEIYHPVALTQIDATYSVFAINLASGEVENKLSFVGSQNETTVYMSPHSIYAAYSMPVDFLGMTFSFFENSDKFPADISAQFKKLKNYELSYNTKAMEVAVILNNYKNSLKEEARKKFEQELNEEFKIFINERKREMEKTSIVKIGLDDFQIKSTGSVPGRLLNQFSLDEYNGNLRLATTIGQSRWEFGLNFEDISVNDLYILDENLKTVGAVTDLGKGETIYSIRFIEDKGYMVTFKQIDPFFVMDLSDPKNPQVKGELKIPGFSSYLHPLSKTEILGIGREENKVKLSLFSVANPENPAEIARYPLDDYWSEIFNNHHAFLLDEKHKIFFIPGEKGYIFSYEGNELALLKIIEDFRPLRAAYINDYLYLIGEDRILVLDEGNWEEVGELELK